MTKILRRILYMLTQRTGFYLDEGIGRRGNAGGRQHEDQQVEGRSSFIYSTLVDQSPRSYPVEPHQHCNHPPDMITCFNSIAVANRDPSNNARSYSTDHQCTPKPIRAARTLFPAMTWYCLALSPVRYTYFLRELLLDEESAQMRQLPCASDTEDDELDHGPSNNAGVCSLRLVAELSFAFL